MIETIITVVTALGGLELIKYLHTRRASKRTANASAADKEFDHLTKTNIWLETQLEDKTKHIREMNEQIIDLTKELAVKRCEVQKCPKRQPPNGY